MSLSSPNDIYASGGLSASKIVGILLTFLGAGVILWTVAEIFALFTHGSAFLTLDGIVPHRIVLLDGSSSLLLPRELLVFGIPIWALTIASRIGLQLMKSGLQYVELPPRGGGK